MPRSWPSIGASFMPRPPVESMRGAVAALLLMLLPPVADSAYRPWVPRFLTEYPLAVCNDGSTAAYYHRMGLPGSRWWVVYLDGVGWCWDGPSCAHPWQRSHGTSSLFPKSEAALSPRAHRYLSTGLFDPDKSPLAEAHIAFVKSCSNDAFMGDRSPSEPIGGIPWPQRDPARHWHFRGRQIVEAVFADLRNHTGLGSQMGDRVVYGGCSAGARGALVTLDHVAGSPDIIGKAGVVGLLDSGFWVPISPWTKAPDWDSFGHQMRASLDLFNSSFALGDRCPAIYQGVERWKCLMGSYRIAFVRTPYFMVHSQYDKFALTMNLWGHWSEGIVPGNFMKWVESYRELVNRYLPVPQNGSGSVVFSPACYFHCIVTKAGFWTTTANGTRLSDMMKQWLDSPYTSRRITETCGGFDCGTRRSFHLRQLQVPATTRLLL